METKQIINGLLDRADRVADQSAGRIMKRAAERLQQLQAHNDALECERQAWLHDQEEFSPVTHADFIRAMTDEQLAEFLLNFFVDNMDINDIPHEKVNDGDKRDLLMLLQMPAEVE